MPINTPEVFGLAAGKTPVVETHILKGSFRNNVADSLVGGGNVGIELGVAQGIFSSMMVNSGKFRLFFGVDAYGDTHDTEEYKFALKNVGLESDYRLLRMNFDDALNLFEDNYFDFIYVDGFAHTGEEGGKTFYDWFPKLKVGGIMAGDDYHDDWPLVKWAVNDFALKCGCELWLTENVEETSYCQYPSWFIKKEKDYTDLKEPDSELTFVAAKEKERVYNLRMSYKCGWRYYAVKLLEKTGTKNFVKNLLKGNQK